MLKPLFALLIMAALLAPDLALAKAVRVGVYNAPPGLILEADNPPRGIAADVLAEVARLHRWEVTFVPGSLADGLRRLRSGEIDLLPYIDTSPERASMLDFSRRKILLTWGEVYAHPGAGIDTIQNLNGQRVALERGTLLAQSFMALADEFELKLSPVWVDDMAAALAAVAHGDAAAAVISRAFGEYAGGGYDLVRTPIAFNPTPMAAAVARGTNGQLLADFDATMDGLVTDPASSYYASRERWLSPEPVPQAPYWLKVALATLLTAAVVLAALAMLLRARFVRQSENLMSEKAANEALRREVAERKTAEDALRLSQRRFNLATRSGGVGIMELDFDSRAVSLSPDDAGALGYEPSELPQDMDALRSIIHPDDVALAREAFQRMRAKGPDELELLVRMRPKKGDWRFIELRGQCLRGPGGHAQRFLGAYVDVTERKQMEGELIAARDRAEAASLAKGEFLANMSHEIRTPLNGVMGMLQLLMRTPLDERQRKYVDTAASSGQSLLAVINDILDLSKIEAGRIEISRERFLLPDVIRSVMDIFRPQAEQKGLSLGFSLDPVMPQALIADPGRLRQVLFNLVGNAIKFTNEGRIEVKARAATEGEDRLRLFFSVSDTGVGIPADMLGRIFDAFTQVDGSFSRKYQGTGLGLGIVRRLVRLMGGETGIESRLGHGTTVHFSIMAEPADSLPSDAPKAGHWDTAASYRVLLAEDNKTNQLAAMGFLEEAGHSVSLAENGREVLELLARERFDCVLMDIQMPEVSGLEATRRIRAGEVPWARHIPIIAMTAHTMKGDRELFLSSGMDGYMSKPVDMAEFTALVREVTARKQSLEKV